MTDHKANYSEPGIQAKEPHLSEIVRMERLCEKELEVQDELNRVRTHRDSLQPVHPAYVKRKQKAGHEIDRLTAELDAVRKKLYFPRAREEKETTKDRDARLQRRFNELYAKMRNKKRACHKLAEEEKQQSGITEERLMTIMRVPHR